MNAGPLLAPEPADPVTMAPERTPLAWRERQRAYEESRARHREIYPIRSVADFKADGSETKAWGQVAPNRRTALEEEIADA